MTRPDFDPDWHAPLSLPLATPGAGIEPAPAGAGRVAIRGPVLRDGPT